MAKYRKKPVVIEAVHWTGKNRAEVQAIAGEGLDALAFEGEAGPGLLIRTREGLMRADVGDWIIRGVEGELYPCKPSIFDASYEAVSEG